MGEGRGKKEAKEKNPFLLFEKARKGKKTPSLRGLLGAARRVW
jgi:hypothetical protein